MRQNYTFEAEETCPTGHFLLLFLTANIFYCIICSYVIVDYYCYDMILCRASSPRRKQKRKEFTYVVIKCIQSHLLLVMQIKYVQAKQRKQKYKMYFF